MTDPNGVDPRGTSVTSSLLSQSVRGQEISSFPLSVSTLRLKICLRVALIFRKSDGQVVTNGKSSDGKRSLPIKHGFGPATQSPDPAESHIPFLLHYH